MAGGLLDEETVAMLLATSSAEARRRFWDEAARGVPAYDHDPHDPRAYAVVCARAGCGRRVLVGSCKGAAQRRYCCQSCVALAYYYRHHERVLARQRAYDHRRREAA